MKNWMQRFEENKDDAREKDLNNMLEKLLDLLDEANSDKDRLKVIKEIIDVYDSLRIEVFDFDEQDYLSKRKELAEIRYKIMKRKHMESIESKSWNDYEEEEKVNDERDQGEER